MRTYETRLREELATVKHDNATLRGRLYVTEEALRRTERELGELRQRLELTESPYSTGWGGED